MSHSSPAEQSTSARTHYRICPLCEACCGLEIQTRGAGKTGRVVAIRGAANDVLSGGYLCPKAVALKDLHEDPDRVRTPLVRREGRFVPVSWDEAFAEVERRLVPLIEERGRDAVAVAVGNPSAHKMGALLYFSRLAKALGTKNVYSASTLDQMPKQLANGWMFGHWLSMPIPDIPRTQWLLVIGANPMVSNGSLWTVPDFRGKAKGLRGRGGKLIVIDPRRTETAAVADEHHFIRPGADVFLLAGMVHTLFAEALVRPGRIEPHLAGIEAVREATLPFVPERVAARCGIEAGTIRRLARELAAAPKAAVYGRLGTCTQRFGTLASWLIEVLNALSGHLDEPGGAMFAKAAAFADNTQGPPGKGRGITTGRHASRVSGAPEVWGELPMTCLAEEIETPGGGQVRALITVASNPVLSAPGGPRLAAALAGLDFMVSVDIYVNETTRHADVILPGQSPLEHSHYDVAFPQFSWRNQARFSEAVFEPAAGHLPEWQVLLKLAAIARGLGARADANVLDDEALAADLRKHAGERAPSMMEALSPLRGPERLLELALRSGPYGDGFGARPGGLTLAQVRAASGAGGGVDLGELQPRIPEMLRTPSGKVELAPPACLRDLAHALAALDEPAPELVVIGRRDVRSNNSWMHNLPTLAKGPERCTLLVHPSDAAARGLVDGSPAQLAGAGRTVQVIVQVDPGSMPGVVCLPHGWGHGEPGTAMGVAAERPGANLNALLEPSARDPLSGNSVLSGGPVSLKATVPG
ncbi:MAG: molybdopterin-dependent oxidoreductase [Burkholderiales bacterium]|nr:molybdopterin-dependent oxidoreductase [Burkholderiales bacterium]